VLEGLKHRLLTPERVEEAVRAYEEEVSRLEAAQVLGRAEDEGRLEAVHRKIGSMIRAIEDGLYQPSMKARMAELEAERATLEERLAATPEPPKVRPHPNLAGAYRQKVAVLEKALAQPEVKEEAMEILRGHIERLTLTPDAHGGLEVMLHGDLARILWFCEAGERIGERPGRGVPGRGSCGRLSVVAGARSHLCRTIVAWARPCRSAYNEQQQLC
jgi:site-specific DNA recombinase